MPDNEEYLIIYDNRSEYHRNDAILVYAEGFQSAQAQQRYNTITESLSEGYLEKMYSSIDTYDFSDFSDENKMLLKKLADGISSNNGRAIAALTFLQLTIKSITPEQNIRLHKGNSLTGKFSWTDGISMRIIDKTYITKFLREKNLIKLNADGIFMTRSLAENYPYTKLYKAKIQGPFKECLDIVDTIEDGTMAAEHGLRYFTILLRNKSEEFIKVAKEALKENKKWSKASFEEIQLLLTDFFNKTHYSARAYEVVMHGLLQALYYNGYTADSDLCPLSQMRNANKKHGNIGDIELKTSGIITESWDAKYGKAYLRDELEELRDKILESPGVQLAGFVSDSNIDRRIDIMNRVNEIEFETGASIKLFNFDEWVEFQLSRVPLISKGKIAVDWLTAVVESLAQNRREIAPIDEPCEEWVRDLIQIMRERK